MVYAGAKDGQRFTLGVSGRLKDLQILRAGQIHAVATGEPPRQRPMMKSGLKPSW